MTYDELKDAHKHNTKGGEIVESIIKDIDAQIEEFKNFMWLERF